MNFSTDNIILICSILLIIGVGSAKFSSRLGLPSLVLFVAVGLVLNHFIHFQDASITQLVGIIALIIILFDGGMQTNWKHIRPVIKTSLSLSTLGVLLSTVLVGVFARYILDLNWLESFLFGSIVGSTDAAAIFSVLGSKNIKGNLTAALEAESGTNDPMAFFLTISFIEIISDGGKYNVISLILKFIWEMGFGLVMGLVIGKVSVYIINKIKLDESGLYPVLAIGFAIFGYSLTTVLHGSGLLAVYVLAVYIGNQELRYHFTITRFNSGFAWLMQMLMFITLGLFVFPDNLLSIVEKGIIISLLVIFVGRPIGVFLSTLFSKFTFKERIFLSWGGLKGAVPVVLAIYPLFADLSHAGYIFNLVFFVVLASALIQGTTMNPLAERLGLIEKNKSTPPRSLELLTLGRTQIDMIEVKVEEFSWFVGKEIMDLNLPDDALITAIIRGESFVIPQGDTEIKKGDALFILVPIGKMKEFDDMLAQKE
ncbi:potassium/proton antiporter [Peribacillus kribbensis]|uniref:potassium/proton antiporter n=1 Tax=Peribacillus kribbensis TaxID=356658 RepID=UPI000405E440|nr:potassium/proton antiporter [Peribacillus kribbensis]